MMLEVNFGGLKIRVSVFQFDPWPRDSPIKAMFPLCFQVTYAARTVRAVDATDDVANGQVFTQCKARHRHQEFPSFLRHIETHVPDTLDVPLGVDNYGTHRPALVKVWLARRPRCRVGFRSDSPPNWAQNGCVT